MLLLRCPPSDKPTSHCCPSFRGGRPSSVGGDRAQAQDGVCGSPPWYLVSIHLKRGCNRFAGGLPKDSQIKKNKTKQNGHPSDWLGGGDAVRVPGSRPGHLLSVARAQRSCVLESEVLRHELRVSGSAVGENRQVYVNGQEET